MAYQIRYQWSKETEFNKDNRHNPWIVLGLSVAIVAFTVQLLNATTDMPIHQLLYPLLDPETAETFTEMVNRVRDGMPVPEALAAFCLGILEHAG